MTTLSSIFAKPIDRPIEGVIKADDEDGLRLEVEEYVLTGEVSKRLDAFLKAYLDYQGANGVWISGFFGSGKSHLLKMLALILENRLVDGVPALDLFLEKEELHKDTFLRADLERAVAIPSRSILFNIDQKADVISKQQIDALLAVFVKVFDEMCGYYGKQGHIARFERDLDSRGQYVAFQDAYRGLAGQPWEMGREQTLLEAYNIAQAYAQVTGAPAQSSLGILDKYRQEYRVSIEDFAESVNDYIVRQGNNFRLNFFVDEVGQYIADNTKLMTNLQTLAESLATKCRGRAWIMVTAQEDMQTVMGEMGKQQSNDFSKIQARFSNRMKLTSQDVEEVIRKRLLHKNQTGHDLLVTVYQRQQNNFRTLFDFADGSQSYRNFRDQEHFVQSYPFVPYQFPLFQAAIENLSAHAAFEGKHSSVGERSMLGVFQEVAKGIGQHEVGQLATFDLMFEGIRNALKSQIQRSILTAENQLTDAFAVQVLKALFLVKYVKEFKATARNLTVLMYSSFDSDLPALGKRVEAALNLLEQQTYIQRNGDVYEYLTDEEKDVEQEIKNTEVENDVVAEELGQIVFDGVLKHRKIRYDENGQDYAFARKLDDKVLGREYELAIHVISPFHEHSGNEMILRSQSMGRDELLVALPSSDRLVRDLLLYKRTDKYVRQNVSITQQESIRRILSDKSSQNRERQSALRKLVEELVGKATLIVNGQELVVGSGDGQTRIVQGFHQLLVRTYANLRLLRGMNYREGDVVTYLQQASTLYGNDEATVSEAENEMQGFIQANRRNGLRTTMVVLVNQFERKPYGWYLAAIQCTLAKLIARGRVEVRQDGTLLEETSALDRALRNTHAYSNLVLDPQVEYTASQVRALRDFHADFFNGPPTASEARALAQESAAAFARLEEELVGLRGRSAAYPFLVALDAPLALLAQVTDRSYDFYLTDLRGHEDRLSDAKEDVIAPVRSFMAGQQRQIYDDARTFLATHEANLSYVAGDEAQQIRTVLADPACFRGNAMQRVKGLYDGLRAKVETVVESERARSLAAVDEIWTRLAGVAEFALLTGHQQETIQQPFNELRRSLARQTLIAVIRDQVRLFNEMRYPELLDLMTEWATPVAEPVPAGSSEEPAVAEPRTEYVAQRNLRVDFDRAWLADEADVEEYLAALRTTLLREIEDGKRIRL
jgi:hypothetical protein